VRGLPRRDTWVTSGPCAMVEGGRDVSATRRDAQAGGRGATIAGVGRPLRAWNPWDSPGLVLTHAWGTHVQAAPCADPPHLAPAGAPRLHVVEVGRTRHGMKTPRKEAKRRVNITLPESCYAQVTARGLKFSGFIANLINDHFAGSAIILRVSEDTKRLYEQVVSNTGYGDPDIEVRLRVVLQDLLGRKIAELEHLRKQLVAATGAATPDDAS
jgi:hypothetical protein